MRYLLDMAWRRRKAGAVAQIMVLSALRLGRLITHRRLKWGILDVSDSVLTDKDIETFAKTLTPQFNPGVKALMQQQKTVLATAAPARYVAKLAELLGVEYVATERPQSGKYSEFVECRGSEKLRRVTEKWGRDNDVVTDHADDLALLAATRGRKILVNPSASTLATVRMAGVSVEVWP